jgi:hypothetical protein
VFWGVGVCHLTGRRPASHANMQLPGHPTPDMRSNQDAAKRAPSPPSAV